ncbi:polysaccharide lyase family 8 super-sandwich domain-containing protein [Gelidibacter maritimus]|uniref:Chondroitin AC lyase n=1 Tax=Gelidibacter maritimus TaxID=2761487 RepID=A0A7W2M8H2_9FLAO|nr:polysaccharide lyase family 8 super-sandwich domain-containing protein [Gelidibacter maritimus]MBA6154635.1 hypothetical protein [Gelidibacter maritimus]
MRIASEFIASFKTILIICSVFVFTISNLQAQEYNFQQLRARVANSQSTNIAEVAVMDDWISNQNFDGSWPDMTYGNIALTDALNNNHIHRLWHLAAACTRLDHIKYNDSGYKNAVKNGLQFWYDSKSNDANWWFNKIYFPQRLGEILIFMRAFDGVIPQNSSVGIDEPEILSLFNPTEIKDITSHSTGANAIDIALHYVYRGLLTENGQLLEVTRNKLETLLTDNIKADMVYQDHGPQIMIASYGPVFSEGLLRLASYLADSPAAFDTKSESFSKVIRFIRDTQISSIRGRSWDFNILGRGVSRYNALKASLGYLHILAETIDPENATSYLDALGRLNGTYPPDYNVRTFNKQYWVSDYMQHARSGYLFTIRNTSTRTAESETGNGENLKANYFSYGANFMAIDGNEYTNIMPVWDWAMIPGATFPYIETFPKRRTWGSNFGNTTFVGGVSNGTYGASVLSLDEANISAKKSWFLFDDEMVCLGAGIVDHSNTEVRTTINQAWMQHPSYYNERGKATEKLADISSDVYLNSDLKYIRNGKFGYYFPNETKVKFTMQSKSGTWLDINKIEDSTKTEAGNVFSLWVDHGKNPDNASYSYIVVPNIDSNKKAQAYDMNALDIIENTTTIQAVYHKALNLLQAIFYQAGTVEFQGMSVSVDRPCALLLDRGTSVTVSNPSQTYSNVLVRIKKKGKTYAQVVELPTGGHKEGASVTVNFKIP